MRQSSVRKVQSAKVQAGEPPLVFGAGMDTIRGQRLYGRYAVAVAGQPAAARERTGPRGRGDVSEATPRYPTTLCPHETLQR